MNENVPNTDSGRRQECVQRNRETLEPEQQTPYRNDVDGCCPTHLDLFSGIGGFALAAQWAGFRTIGFCEIDKYCRKVLAKNFLADAEGNTKREHEGGSKLPQRKAWMDSCGQSSPRIHANIFNLDGRQFAGVSLITGGFPCQPFSVAGKRRGAADDRAIWPEMFRVINEARPAWVLCENVPGIIPMELDNVLSDLESIGYATRPFVIPACAVDARHRRDRLWVVANDCERRCSRTNGREIQLTRRAETECGSKAMADADCDERNSRSCNVQMGRRGREGEAAEDHDIGRNEWLTEPDVGRVAHGIPSRVDRLKGLGNAIVPQVAYEILRDIRKLI